MAKGFNIEVAGLEQVQKRFKSMPGKLRSELNGEFEDAAKMFANLAKNAAPADQGFLRNQINSYKEGDLNYVVVSSADYSAFVEFGTGIRVNIPAGLESYAAQFRAKGTPGSAYKMISEWCRRKGIEPKFWYAIYLSIMAKGIRPQPYFFPQLPKVKPKLKENAKKVVSRL